MTLDDVKEAIKRLKYYAYKDPENAHAVRDDLYVRVLEELASQGNVLAQEAIKAKKIELRWDACA
jgi:hypothetical protein